MEYNFINMGCKEYNRKVHKEDMEILIEKKQHLKSSNDSFNFDLNKEKKNEEELRDIFYKNLNDEQALVKYLNNLKNNKHMEEFESELLLYFDALSAKNRSRFTGIKDFSPSINIFINVIEYLCDNEFQKIKEMKYYKRSYDICERKKFITSKSFSNISKYDLSSFYDNQANDSLKNEYDFFQSIEKKRKLQKISLLNSELYFNSLLQTYFEIIEKSDNNHLTIIGLIANQLSDLIFDYIKLIQKNQIFSEADIRIINILFYAPIIGNYEFSSIKRLLSNTQNSNENFDDKSNDIFESNNKLVLNYCYTRKSDNKIVKNKVEFENSKIYNIELIKNEIVDGKSIALLTQIKLLKYVKTKYFQENNFYTHNKEYWNFNKELFKYILHSKTIRTLFQKLYPNRIFIFENEENINQLINSIIFVPYELYESYGCTSKKELIIFIGGLFEGFSKPIHYLSKSSSFLILGIHEGCGHWASSFYSILFQDKSLFSSFNFSEEVLEEIRIEVKDENNSDDNDILSGKEGGNILEFLLFGRILNNFSIKEILFLLNKNSFDVDHKTFKKNFKEVSNRKFNDLYDSIPKNSELFNIMKNLKIDKAYFTNLKNRNNLNCRFKRDGDILINSKCGDLRF